MAKKEMICPFSGNLCKNCSLYIGRHYLLCNKESYRGYMKRRKTKDNDRFASTENRGDFDVPDFEYREDLDPYTEDDTI